MPKKAAKAATKPKKPAKPPVDWVAVLKTGAEGVKKWNKLTGKQRKAADIGRGDFSGCDLSGINLRRTQLEKLKAPGAKFVGAQLARLWCRGSDFRGADFAGCRRAARHVLEQDSRGFEGGGTLERVECLAEAPLRQQNLAGHTGTVGLHAFRW